MELRPDHQASQDGPSTLEITLLHADGSPFFAQLDGLRLVTDGVPLMLLVLTNITARKKAEAALREQERLFRLIAENLGDFIAVLDLEGRRIYNSPSYQKLFGNTKDLIGTNSFADIHEDDRPRIIAAFRETVRTGIGQRSEYRFRLADGSIRQMESVGAVIRDSEGRVARVVVVAHDVTERKLAEEQIRHLALYDDLTQLPNRRLLLDRLGKEHRNTPSVGITLFCDQRTAMDELLKQADLAMYQAKSAGRNGMRFFEPSALA